MAEQLEIEAAPPTRDRATEDRPAVAVSRRAFVCFAAGLVACAAGAYGWYVLHGGLYSDDWGNARAYRFAATPRYLSAVRGGFETLGGRPLLAALLPLPHALFGTDARLHLTLAASLAVATSAAFWILLRQLAVPAIEAAAMSVLALIFPWADAIELWPTASINTVAVILFFGGLIVALRGLSLSGRKAVAWHAVAALLYLLSVLTYEVCGAAAALAGLLYLTRAPRRAALWRWATDVVVVTASLTYALVRTIPVRHVGTLHDRIVDVKPMAYDATVLLGQVLVPIHRYGRVLHPLAIVGAAVLTVLVTIRWRGGIRDDSTRWLAFGCGCVVALAAAYFMFLGSSLGPLQDATGTRTNVFARFAYAGVVVALVAAAASLAFRRPATAKVATFAVVFALAGGYALRLHSDEAAWVRAAAYQRHVLAAIDSRFPRLQSGTTLVTFGAPGEASPGAPVFVADWDLNGALEVRRNDASLHAFPVYEGVTVSCGPHRLVLDFPGSRGNARVPYRRLFFFDVARNRAAQVATHAACENAHTFRPGPRSVP